MKLEGKRALIARTLGVGKGRVGFNREHLGDMKEAITKQDIREMFASGAIFIRDLKGRKTIVKSKGRRRHGKIKNPARNRKREYMVITRKLRAYVGELKKQGILSLEQSLMLRREIRARKFRNKAHLKERLTLFKEK